MELYEVGKRAFPPGPARVYSAYSTDDLLKEAETLC